MAYLDTNLPIFFNFVRNIKFSNKTDLSLKNKLQGSICIISRLIIGSVLRKYIFSYLVLEVQSAA